MIAPAKAPEKVKLAIVAVSRNRHYQWAEILPRHWIATAKACGIGAAVAQSVLDGLASATPRVVAEVAAQRPPRFPASVAEPVLRGLEKMPSCLGGA